MTRNFEDITTYIQSQLKTKVLSAKPEQTFKDLGYEVNVWNVKTESKKNWWVVEGEQIPMNLYSQEAYYFSVDEVYSFHMGLMERLSAKESGTYIPDNFVNALTINKELTPVLFRKLKSIATLIDKAFEIEDFQSIGVQCREVLIELGNNLYQPEMSLNGEQPQASNFKKKAELYVQYYLPGGNNSDYRSIIKKMTEATWDYASKITHSQSATYYEVSTCVTLVISLVSVYENIRQKVVDPMSQYQCKYCKSKKLDIIDDEHDENNFIKKLFLKCEECKGVTEITFEKYNGQ